MWRPRPARRRPPPRRPGRRWRPPSAAGFGTWQLSLPTKGSDGGDGPLVVGAAVRGPQDHGRAGRRAARAVERGAGGLVDDLVAPVAERREPPLLVVAPGPRGLHGVDAVAGAAGAVGDH